MENIRRLVFTELAGLYRTSFATHRQDRETGNYYWEFSTEAEQSFYDGLLELAASSSGL